MESTDMLVARIIRSVVDRKQQPDSEAELRGIFYVASKFADEFFPFNHSIPNDSTQIYLRKEFMVACGFDTRHISNGEIFEACCEYSAELERWKTDKSGWNQMEKARSACFKMINDARK